MIIQMIIDVLKKFLVLGEQSGNVTIYDLPSKGCVRVMMLHTDCVCSLAFSHVPFIFASGGRDKVVKLVNIQQESIRSFKGHRGTVYLVALDHGAKYLASAGSDKMLNVWNAETGGLIVTYNMEKSPINSMSWSNSGQFLVIGLDNGEVCLIDFNGVIM
jgi:WD40 repeat protein